jgi:exosortase D (VPLPA-CTERM-specific)
MGVLFAYFYRAALWKRLVLVLSTIPLTILINSLRIALTAIIYAHLGAAAAEGFFHGFSGWLIFMVSVAVLLAEIWGLRRIAPGPGESFFGKPAAKQSTGEGIKERSMNKGWGASFSSPQFIVGSVLLVLTLSISLGVEFREKMPASKHFSQFPLTVGAWAGTRQHMEEMFIKSLDLSDYTMIDFKSADGKRVGFYVAYYESQRKGESIHSPETCLPGGGWVFKEAGDRKISLSGGKAIAVNSAFMEKAGEKQLAYYWFPQRGRVLTNAYQLKIFTFWDALTKHRTDGALVRLITPVYDTEDPAEADRRLAAFTQEIVPVVNQFIPN